VRERFDIRCGQLPALSTVHDAQERVA
jgi:hypothetical protein